MTTQILVPNNKSAPVNKKNARALFEDGIFSRFERKLLTEEESKARAHAPKMEAGRAPLDAFLGSSCVAPLNFTKSKGILKEKV